MNKAARSNYCKAITEDYFHFFVTVTEAMEQDFHVLVYQLFETKNLSIQTAVKDLKNLNSVLAQNLQSRIDTHKPLLAKVFAIRCNVHGHRSASKAPEDVYAHAKLTPKEMGTLVELAQEIVASLAEASSLGAKKEIAKEIHHAQQYARDSAKRLLEALVRK